MADLTPEARAQIAARVAAATPGPWAVDAKACFGFCTVRAPDRKAVCGMPENESWPRARANAEAIAHAPADLAALLAHADAQDAEVERLRARLEAAEADSVKTRAAARRELDRYEGNRTVWLAERDTARSRLGEAVALLEALAEPVRDHLGECYGVVLDQADAFLSDRAADRVRADVQITHAPDCWRYHHACAVARLEAVAEVRAGLVERERRARVHADAAEEFSTARADRAKAAARAYEIAADLLGKALEG